MNQSLGPIGGHPEVVKLSGHDVNGREMFQCGFCRTVTHDKAHFSEPSVPCMPLGNCRNCLALTRSQSCEVAVPVGGTCNDITHTCPNCGRRWWQSNVRFHLWQQVTHPREWQTVRSWGERGSSHPAWGLGK